MKKGFLISFEGGEGCGKSTQIKKFVKYLEDNKFDFLCTREPGGTEVGEKIREILLMSKENLSSETEFLLFSASRRKLLEDVVCPALESGKIVVLDRFFDSSYRDAAKKAFDGMVTNSVTYGDNGELYLHDTCKSARLCRKSKFKGH